MLYPDRQGLATSQIAVIGVFLTEKTRTQAAVVHSFILYDSFLEQQGQKHVLLSVKIFPCCNEPCAHVTISSTPSFLTRRRPTSAKTSPVRAVHVFLLRSICESGKKNVQQHAFIVTRTFCQWGILAPPGLDLFYGCAEVSTCPDRRYVLRMARQAIWQYENVIFSGHALHDWDADLHPDPWLHGNLGHVTCSPEPHWTLPNTCEYEHRPSWMHETVTSRNILDMNTRSSMLYSKLRHAHK